MNLQYRGFKTRSSAANPLKKQMLKPLHLQSQRFIFVCWSTKLLNRQVLCGSTNGFANIGKGPLRGWRGAWNGDISTAKLVASKSQSLSTTAYTKSLMVEPMNAIQIILWRWMTYGQHMQKHCMFKPVWILRSMQDKISFFIQWLRNCWVITGMYIHVKDSSCYLCPLRTYCTFKMFGEHFKERKKESSLSYKNPLEKLCQDLAFKFHMPSLEKPSVKWYADPMTRRSLTWMVTAFPDLYYIFSIYLWSYLLQRK